MVKSISSHAMNNYARWIVLVRGVTGRHAQLNVVAGQNRVHSKLPRTLCALANHAPMLIINRMSPRVIPTFVLWIVWDHGPVMVHAMRHVAVVCLSVRSPSQRLVLVLVQNVPLLMDKLTPRPATLTNAL